MNKTLSTIIKHGLSIRQIPLEDVSLRSLASFTMYGGSLPDNPDIVEFEIPDSKLFLEYHKKNPKPDFRIEGEKVIRRYVKVVKIPKNAGYWMCKKVSSTSSKVEWSSKTDNLAPTLEKSVEKFLAAINK